MSALLTSSSASTSPSTSDDVWCIVIFGFGVILFAFFQWRFKSGWQMQTGRLAPRAATRDLVIRLGFTALPGLIVCLSAVGLFLVALIYDEADPNAVQVLLVLVFATGFFGAGVWLAKEFYRPTQRRTPTWLRQESGGPWEL